MLRFMSIFKISMEIGKYIKMSTSKPMFGPVVLEITYMIYSTFSMNIVCNFSMTRILKDSTESKDACLVFSLEHQSLSTFTLN